MERYEKHAHSHSKVRFFFPDPWVLDLNAQSITITPHFHDCSKAWLAKVNLNRCSQDISSRVLDLIEQK